MAGADARRRGGGVAKTTRSQSRHGATSKQRGRFDHDVFKRPRQGSLRAALVQGAPLSQFEPWPSMGEDYEHVLTFGGDTGMTWARLERQCLFMLTEMIAAVTTWRWSDSSERWKIGDHAVLILETTAAKDVSLYTQIWSEPLAPVAWEVSSGNFNSGAKPFIDGDPAARIEAMGFALRGTTGNFRKEVSALNRGDALVMARTMLRLFYEAFGYRGATPLVVRVFRQQRATTDAVVHTALSLDDTRTLLRVLGFHAETAESEPTVLFCARDNIGFTARLDGKQDGRALYHCLDLASWVGQAADFEDVGWINRLNEVSRVARVAVDDEGTVLMGTGIILFGGVTEDYLSNRIKGWFDTVADVVGGKLPGTKKRKRRRRAPAGTADGEGSDRNTAPVVH